jgi:glycosyltransferase involved in cell wall biosynthesis
MTYVDCDLTNCTPAIVDANNPATRLMKFVAAFGAGGTERQFVNLGLALDPSRFAISFGCLHRSGRFLEDLEARGVPILDYNVCTFKRPQAIGAQLRLARDVRRFGIKIVHTYNFYANVFAIPAARFAGARVVASIRDMGPYLSPNQRRLQRWVCGLADRIAVNANAIRDWLIGDGYDRHRIVVIPNGIDTERFCHVDEETGTLHRELNIPQDAPIIGVISRVVPLKGLEIFLRAAAVVASRFPEARFLIVGESTATRNRRIESDTTYPEELARLAAQLGVQDRIILAGFRSDVERILPELAVSVQPSLSEGLSNALLESMASGVPVVATRVGDAAEAVRDGDNGLLVPAGDVDSLAQAICRLLDAPVLATRLGSSARQTVVERFSTGRMLDATSRLYESLL